MNGKTNGQMSPARKLSKKEARELLKARGKLEQFNKRREQVSSEQNISTHEATWVVLDEYFPGMIQDNRKYSEQSVQQDGGGGSSKKGSAPSGEKEDRRYSKIDPSQFDDGNASMSDVVRWVGKNIGISDVNELTPFPNLGNPPREAVNLLNWVNATAGNEDEFWIRTYSRFISAKTAEEEKKAFEDDGRGQMKMVERARQAKLKVELNR